MLYIKDSYASKFSEIAEYWGDKMPIMACEEFAELQEAIIRYTASNYSDRAEIDCKRRISEEVADELNIESDLLDRRLPAKLDKEYE